VGAGQTLAENGIIIIMMRGMKNGIVGETETEIMIMIIVVGMDTGIGAMIGVETVIGLESETRTGIEDLRICMIMMKIEILC